jgi:hypothetical protein
MTCTCKSGFSGKGDERCEKITEPIQSGCSADADCPDNLACNNRNCVNPCSTENPCATLATCIAKSHRASCTCPSGMTGDPHKQCEQSKLLELPIHCRTCNR